MTSVIVEDRVRGYTTVRSFSRNEAESVAQDWYMVNPLLVHLQSGTVFPNLQGRLSWSDLEPSDFKMLIAMHLNLISELSPDVRDHPLFRSLDILSLALCHCLERLVDGRVDTLTLVRISGREVAYKLSMRLDDLEIPTPKSVGGGLRIVVDNTI